MEIQFYGANCVRVGNKKVNVIIDDNLSQFGLKSVTSSKDIALFTLDKDSKNTYHFCVDGPGEYEVSGVSVLGIPTKAHVDAEGSRATVYRLQIGSFSVGVVGHIDPNLTDDQLEQLGLIDILIIPVGGSGYTLDAVGATNLVKRIEPKIVIPTHYNDAGIKYEVPQSELKVFLDEIGASDPEQVDILKLKDTDLGDKTRVVIVRRSK